MRLEYYDSAVLKREILEIISRRLGANKYRAFVFGSRVSGGGDEHSDIDIGIEGDMPLSGGVLEGIREDIEDLDTLYSIDVVDFAAATDQFKKIALKHTESLS